jgi:holo-[acyl-carrier protein] synthase
MSCIGIDIVEIDRVELAIEKWGKRFLNRIYTEAELKLCERSVSSLAGRFAGKEAIMKVLGTGVRGVNWREIEILADARGKPLVRLCGKAENRARELKLSEFSISLSDTKHYAVAAAIGS